MKQIHINKGHHYSNEWSKPLFYCKSYERAETRTYVFDDSCRYSIGTDQSDKNKLFGWSYGFHHKNSIRASWWYNPDTDKIEIGLYAYVDGNVVKLPVASVSIGNRISINICICDDGDGNTDALMCAWGNRVHYGYVSIKMSERLPKWGYTLTTYFGGNKTAPHKITMQYEWKNM